MQLLDIEINIMKIGFIMSHPVFAPTNGVVSQAYTWKKGLEQLGHDVVLVNMWDRNDWKSFDVLHFFGFSVYMAEFIQVVHHINANIAISPILDPNYSITNLKLRSYWGNRKLNLMNPFYALRKIKPFIKWIFVRSEFEQEYMIKGFGFDKARCPIIPLSFGIDLPETKVEKEPFCLHISLLCDDRKNVKRLIEAAKKYNFKLVLGGKLRNEEEKQMLASWMEGCGNVEYYGFLSLDAMKDLYARARVFALPSITEGVGIVALEAAIYGCDIVITNQGGPHEYYKNMAINVDPYSVDEIGMAVTRYMNEMTFQPCLQQYVIENYSLLSVAQKIVNVYLSNKIV